MKLPLTYFAGVPPCVVAVMLLPVPLWICNSATSHGRFISVQCVKCGTWHNITAAQIQLYTHPSQIITKDEAVPVCSV